MGKKNTASVEPNENGTKERILKIAAELFSTRGFHATGMAELEKATGLGRGALYYHIGSKEELLFEITSRYLRVLIAEGSPLCESDLPAEDKFRQFSTIVMRTIVTHLAEMTVCFREINSLTGERHAFVSKQHSKYQKIWGAAIDAGVERKIFRKVPVVALKGMLGMYFYSFLWLAPRGAKNLRR